MVFSDDEESDRTYTAKEVKEILAREKAKLEESLAQDRAKYDQDLNDRMSKMFEARYGAPTNKELLIGEGSGSPKKPLSPNGEDTSGALPPKVDVSTSAPPPPYGNVPFTYPPQHVPMPHMNHSGTPPKLDECNFSFWKTSMRSHLRSVCVELWGVVENGFEAVTRGTCLLKKKSIVNSTPPPSTRFDNA